MRKSEAPFAVRRRDFPGPRGGFTSAWDVVDVRGNIVLRRLPSAKLARAMRNSLNASATGKDVTVKRI
jgi:hypothetical protein